ncbi:MAG: hypothetical protein ACREC9_12445 [Methylocella sp.]
MGSVKIPYYVVVKGRGYWRPKQAMRDLGFRRVNCGPDGPAAWTIAAAWALRWAQAKRGEYRPHAPPTAQSRKIYPPSSVGEAFQRYRRTEEWARKAPRTREEWERVWARIDPLLGDVAPGTIRMEDMSAIRANVQAKVSLREAHRVVKIWRALWKVAASMGYCDRGADPSLGVRNSAPAPRQALWREGEAVRLAKGAWRAGYRGLAAVIAASWDTQLSPVDVRGLTSARMVWIERISERKVIPNDAGPERVFHERDKTMPGRQRRTAGLVFMVSRAKTGRAAAGTLSRRAEAVLDAYIAGLGFTLHANAPIFRTRSGAPYSKDTLGDDFRAVRTAAFGPAEHRTLADFRRSGAIEAAAGGADASTIAAKMANTLSASNALHRAYLPVEITKVRAADAARRAGRAKLRGGARSE